MTAPRHRTGVRVRAMRRSAYTLLELSLVLAISALVSAGVIVALAAPYQQARGEDLIARIQTLDRQVRDRAHREGAAWRLEIDLRAGTLSASGLDDDDHSPPPVALGRAVTLTEVQTAERRATYGLVTIDYRPNGQSPSYALRFARAAEPDAWWLVSGLTGQWERLDDEREVQAMFDLVRPADRSDAR